MDALNLRAVGYRRVSTREQLDGFSLDAQANSIRRYTSDRGWQLVNIYTDAGISAKKDSRRPQLARLMDDAKEGRFDVVVVDKIDRFYRHLNGLLNALDQLNELKVTFVSVQERIDFTTPWGKLTLTMLGMLAEIYIDNLRQETQSGKLQRAREGLWNGNIPLGYCRGQCSNWDDPNGPGYCPNVGKPDKGDGKSLILHPIDSQAVKTAFELYQSGIHSDVAIAEKLNQMTFTLPDGMQQAYRQKGIPGRKVPRAYTKDFVRGLLSQIFYTGKVAYYGKGRKRKIEALFPGKHPPLISDEIFRTVMEIREAVKRIPAGKNNHPRRIYPLTGIIFCEACGWPMRGNLQRSNFAYRDAGQVERHGICCQRTVRAIPLENRVIELIYSAIRVWENSVNPELTIHEIECAEEQLRRARELYIGGEISKEIVEREKVRVADTLKSTRENNFNDTLSLTQKVQAVYPHWNSLGTVEQKRLFRVVLKAIFVRDGRVVALQPTFAFLPVMTSLFESCRPDRLSEGKSNQSYPGIELLSPRLNPAEAFLVLDYRRKHELSREAYRDAS